MACDEPKLYQVLWVDSCSQQGWFLPEEIVEADHDCVSVGYVVREDDKSLTLTTTFDCSGSAVDPLSIPRVAIKGIYEVSFAEDTRERT